MSRFILSLSAAAVLLCAGCTLLPSGWRPFGTPLTKERKIVAREAAAKDDVLAGAQEDVHKVVVSLASAPADSRPVQVAKDFAAEAQTLLDGANGVPTVGTQAKWNDLVQRLMSIDTTIRIPAEAERHNDSERMGTLANRLADAVTDREKAEAKVRDYAAQNEHLADMVRKVFWIGGLLVALWLLSQVLAIGSRFTPALAGASKLVNAVAAPAMAYVAGRAEDGLTRIGSAIAEVRQKMPQVAEQVVSLIDAHADADHQAIIAKAATEAGAPPP
jgi:hypothetical protein